MSTPLDPPQKVGDYEVHEVLRRGAAVTTYGGFGPAGEPVVVKELRVHGLAEWKEYDLFTREVDVLAAVHHPSVPRVLAHLRLGDGRDERVCLVMERVPGEPLDQRLQRGAPIEEREVRRVLEGVLEVLAFLHSLAPPILHRDIKPANIILSDERVYLVDFGGVRRFMPWAKGGSTVVGTFGYMAPEQLHGEASPASDLFGAGATAAALLAGCDASELPRKGLRIDLDAIPAAREPLRSIVRRLVEPEVAERFRSAREVLDALGRGAALVPAVAGAQRSRSLVQALPRDAGGMPVLSVAGPPTPAVADPAALEHWGLRRRIHHGLLLTAGTTAAGGLVLQLLRQFGSAGWLAEAGRALFGIAFLLFVGSRFVPTRARMRRRLLKLAKRQRGRVSIVDASMALDIPPEAARDLLDHLVEIRLARQDPDREGAYLILAN